MDAIRQFVDVKDHSFQVSLPKTFNARRVEVIILPSEIEDDIPQWQKTEVLRRLELYKKDPSAALDFDQVMDEIEKDL
jgi:Putative addiction module component